jgi:hypothetical protein
MAGTCFRGRAVPIQTVADLAKIYPTSQLSPLNPEWQEHVSGALQFTFKQWRIRKIYPTSQLSPLNPEWQEHVSGAEQFPFKQWREQWGTQAFSTS